MKKIHVLITGIFLLGISSVLLKAQNVNSQAWGIDAGNANIFGGGKYYLVLTGIGGATNYQLIGISDNTSSAGTFKGSNDLANVFQKPAFVWSDLQFQDETFGNQFLYFKGASPAGGQFSTTRPPSNNSNSFPGPYGSIEMASGQSPRSLTGHSYFLNITDGHDPFVSEGSVIFSPLSETDYVILATSTGVSPSEGTYSYQVANNAAGLSILNDSATGISSKYFCFTSARSGFYMSTQPSGGYQIGTFTVSNLVPAMFFLGQQDVSDGKEYLEFTNGVPFGYYNVTKNDFPLFYHYDLGYEWYIDAQDGGNDCYLYDVASETWFYTGTDLFPYMYDLTLNAWLYYFPDAKRPGHYTTNPRRFYNFATGKNITK